MNASLARRAEEVLKRAQARRLTRPQRSNAARLDRAACTTAATRPVPQRPSTDRMALSGPSTETPASAPPLAGANQTKLANGHGHTSGMVIEGDCFSTEPLVETVVGTHPIVPL
jgi:hypothetical protein